MAQTTPAASAVLAMASELKLSKFMTPRHGSALKGGGRPAPRSGSLRRTGRGTPARSQQAAWAGEGGLNPASRLAYANTHPNCGVGSPTAAPDSPAAQTPPTSLLAGPALGCHGLSSAMPPSVCSPKMSRNRSGATRLSATDQSAPVEIVSPWHEVRHLARIQSINSGSHEGGPDPIHATPWGHEFP